MTDTNYEQEMWKELQETKAMVERLAEALKFYADKENYGTTDTSRVSGNSVYDILLFDFDRDLEPRKDYAGRIARKALTEYEKFKENK